MRNALKARIENLDWMSDETKQKAIEKWDTFLPKIGYPDKWRDWTGLTIAPDNYFANVEAAAQVQLRLRHRQDRQADRPHANGA